MFQTKKNEMESNGTMPDWAKKLTSEISQLRADIVAAKSKEKANDLTEAAKKEGIPVVFAKRYQVTDDNDLETVLSEMRAEWQEVKGISQSEKPKVSEAIKNFTKFTAEKQPEQTGNKVTDAIKNFTNQQNSQNEK